MSFTEEIEDEEVFDDVESEVVAEEEKREKTPGWNNPEMIKLSLKSFFKGLDYHSGGPISNSRILSEEYISLVLNMELADAVTAGYHLINQHGMKYGSFAKSGPYLKNGKPIEDLDIGIFIGAMRRCESLHIWQEYIGGIFLIYLELCEGIKLPRKER